MSTPVNRQITLAARPEGNPKPSDFEIVRRPVPVPGDGQVLLRNTHVSLDPFNRILMGNANSDQEPIGIGDTMFGFTIAVVEQSNHPGFTPGDHVSGYLGTTGWQDYALSDGTDIRLIDPKAAPLTAHLGLLGITGFTAWVGLTKITTLVPGKTLVVTAAAGGVGSAAAQIGKIRGLRVVGVAGGADKTRHLLKDLGLDAAVDYKAPDFAEQLARAVPEGIDFLYENVGATQFPLLMEHMNLNSEVVVGGVMSQITHTNLTEGDNDLPQVLRKIFYRNLSVRGFDVTQFYGDYQEFVDDLTPHVVGGAMHSATQVIDGLETIPTAFPQMFTGRGVGKLVAKIA